MLAQNTQVTEDITWLTNEVRQAVCVGAGPASGLRCPILAGPKPAALQRHRAFDSGV